MYRHGMISTGLLMSIFFWNADMLGADTPEAPLLPMNVEFRYVPQYLDESIPDDPRYARIQALLDEDGCHVILLDKTTDREAFYSTSKRRVDALAANGSDAYITPVDFTASLPKDASPSFLIHFQDRFGNEVSWKFIVGRIVPHPMTPAASAKTAQRPVKSPGFSFGCQLLKYVLDVNAARETSAPSLTRTHRSRCPLLSINVTSLRSMIHGRTCSVRWFFLSVRGPTEQ